MNARAWSLSVAAAFAVLAGCAAHTGVGPTTLPDGVRPFALQSNAPSPSPWQSEPNKVFFPILGPDGSSIWGAGRDPNSIYDAAWRLDIPTGIFQDYPLQGRVNHGHAGPDGNLWFCGQNQIGKISATGVVTYYPEPISNCFGITTGPDRNIWLTDQASIDRVTTSGQLSIFNLPVLVLGAVVTSAKDGLLWFEYETSTQLGLGTFDPSTDKYALFPISSSVGNGGLDSGIDGNAYVVPAIDRRTTGEIIRVTPQGKITRFTNLPKTVGYDNNSENVRMIWFGGRDSHLYGWTTQSHTLIDKGVAPFQVEYPILGPDMNVWFFGGVYLQRLLTVTPQSATLGVGAQQGFAIKETDCPLCVWSVLSSNPGVASVSPVSGGGFTVTGESAGSATITVSDKRYNVVHVPITVN